MIAILLQAAVVFGLVVGALAFLMRKEKRDPLEKPYRVIDRWPRGKR